MTQITFSTSIPSFFVYQEFFQSELILNFSNRKKCLLTKEKKLEKNRNFFLAF